MIMMEMVSCLYLYLYLFVFVFAFVFPAKHYWVIDDEEQTGDGEDDVDDGENECSAWLRKVILQSVILTLMMGTNAT